MTPNTQATDWSPSPNGPLEDIREGAAQAEASAKAARPAFNWASWLFGGGPPPLAAIRPLTGDMMIEDPIRRTGRPSKNSQPGAAVQQAIPPGRKLFVPKDNRALRRKRAAQERRAR